MSAGKVVPGMRGGTIMKCLENFPWMEETTSINSSSAAWVGMPHLGGAGDINNVTVLDLWLAHPRLKLDMGSRDWLRALGSGGTIQYSQ